MKIIIMKNNFKNDTIFNKSIINDNRNKRELFRKISYFKNYNYVVYLYNI